MSAHFRLAQFLMSLGGGLRIDVEGHLWAEHRGLAFLVSDGAALALSNPCATGLAESDVLVR